MLGDDEFAAWFRLLETPGVGRDAARRLLAACGSPDAVFAARPATLRQLVSGAVAEALQSEPETLAPRLAAARHWLQGGTDRGVLTLGDAAYPQRLLQIADPPLLLYVQGDAARLAAPSIAVVGSRHPTPQGEQVSRPSCTAASGVEPIRLMRTEFVGPSVGAELYENGALALLVTIAGIVAYLSLRFEWKFAVAGIVANLHDVVIILGFFAFFQWEFSLAVLAAILAVLGYSVNESVVIFDRIREAFRKFRKLTTPQVIDHAITSTTSRTIITHGSTQMMVLSMLLFGGPTLHYFGVALTIGILFGIYSSIFVAAGICLLYTSPSPRDGLLSRMPSSA